LPEENYLSISDIIDEIDLIEARENAWVSYLEQKLLYDFNISIPGLTFDEQSELLTLDAIEISTEGTVPDSVFVEVNKFNAANEQTPIGSGTIPLDATGTGVYSLTALPVTISSMDERVEILVYTDSSRAQLISQMDVMHILLVS
jgi:hypothetical protein